MIQAKIVADSINIQGDRLTTLEVVMPRYILAEFNTHRMLSKNSASSRAIPFNKMVKSIQDSPFIPYAWQKDHSGMQGSEYHTGEDNVGDINYKARAERNWLKAKDFAIEQAKYLYEDSLVTKQLVNRLLEPFMYHKVLVSGTEWENFFNLRCPQYVLPRAASVDKRFKSWKDVIEQDKQNTSDNPEHVDRIAGEKFLNDFTILQRLRQNIGQADIHMMFLAEAIYDAMNESTPTKLKEGEWHIPYGDNLNEIDITQVWTKLSTKENVISITELKAKISIARCARLSYQTLGDNPVIDYEKDLKLYDSLYKSKHASPFEHVAKVMTESEYNDYTHTKPEYDYEENYYKGKKVEKGWCRNYRGFIMYRELLD